MKPIRKSGRTDMYNRTTEMGDTVVNKGEREDKTADDVYFLCEHAIQTWLFLFVLRVCVCVCVRACICACVYLCACVRACCCCCCCCCVSMCCFILCFFIFIS